MLPASERLSLRELSTAATLVAQAERSKIRLEDHLQRMAPLDLACAICSEAGAQVSEWNPERAANVARLRATQTDLAKIWHAVQRSDAFWVLVHDEPPAVQLEFPDADGRYYEPGEQDLSQFPALAVKPRRARWTTPALPDGGSVFSTACPQDWSPPMAAGETSRPRIFAERPTRQFAIEEPSDYRWLCEQYGHEDASTAASFDSSTLERGDGQFLVLDWHRIAEEFDCVSLSWVGFLRATQELIQLDDAFSYLVGWSAAMTFWFE